MTVEPGSLWRHAEGVVVHVDYLVSINIGPNQWVDGVVYRHHDWRLEVQAFARPLTSFLARFTPVTPEGA